MSTAIAPRCAKCGVGIAGSVYWIGPATYHEECARSVGTQTVTVGVGVPFMPALTEADVRRIVREELDRAAAAIAKEKQL